MTPAATVAAEPEPEREGSTRVDTHVDGTPRRRGSHGFSLVEVLLAVLLLSVAVLSVAGLAAGVARESRRSARETARTLAAQRTLDSVRRAGFERAVDGRATVALDGRRWTVTWAVTREAPGLKRVAVAVSDGDGGDPSDFASIRLHRLPALDSGGAADSGGAR